MLIRSEKGVIYNMDNICKIFIHQAGDDKFYVMASFGQTLADGRLAMASSDEEASIVVDRIFYHKGGNLDLSEPPTNREG